MGKNYTYHSLDRIIERTDIEYKKESLELINQARKKGVGIHYYRKNNPKFYCYLLTKTRKRVVSKVYKNYLFIFNSTQKKLITMYELPEKWKEEIKENDK